MSFSLYNVTYARQEGEDWITAKGDIANETNKNYNTAVFKVSIFNADESIGAAVVKVHNFRAKMTKSFEAVFEGSHHTMISKIARIELFFEAAY